MRFSRFRLLYFPFILALCLWFQNGPLRAQTKPSDTVSATDVNFTPIPSAADSITAARARHKAVGDVNPVVPVKLTAPEHKTLWQIFLAGFIGGFAALLMPCIFPMLPLTVSFFTKKGKAKGTGQAAIYGLSIVIIYVVLGLL